MPAERSEILEKLEEYQTQTVRTLAVIQEQVSGINRRLDISNGRIAKSEDEVTSLKIVDAQVLENLRHVTGQVEEWKRESVKREDEKRQGKQKLAISKRERIYWAVGVIVVMLVSFFLNTDISKTLQSQILATPHNSTLQEN